MSRSKLGQALFLTMLTACAVSVLHGQDNQPAMSDGKVAVPPASESALKAAVGIPEPPLKVVCKGNQLTVTANDSTLASILNEVQRCTGAKIDIPGDAAEIRFFDTIGPLPIQEGLSVLLTASGYNFVIQSSQSDPEKLESVLLMTRGTSPATDIANERPLTPARRVFLKMRQNALTEAGITDQNSPSTAAESAPALQTETPSANSESDAANRNAPADGNQGAAAPPPSTTPQENPSPRSPASEAAPAASEPKTVEDQITNMQQMFEQRRQMMQTPPSPPH